MRILSLGAGIQSTYLYLTETYDYAVFADTQDEPRAVYQHLDWLISLKRCPILIRTKGRLSDHLRRGENSTGQRFASIPCFTAAVGMKKSEGRVRRQCTKEYKTEVVERAIRRDIFNLAPRRRFPKGEAVIMSFGISSDEARRAGRIMERYKGKYWGRPEFPLIQQMLTRADCVRWLRANVPHEVPRSACVYCPNHSDHEWLEMQLNDRESWEIAVQVDEDLRKPGVVANRKIEQPMYLHRSLQPLQMIDFQARIDAKLPDIPLFATRECEGFCGN